jgi:hypothetical protein
MAKKLKPVRPGEILREEFTATLGLSMNRMAMDLRVQVTRIADIVHGRFGITADSHQRHQTKHRERDASHTSHNLDRFAEPQRSAERARQLEE